MHGVVCNGKLLAPLAVMGAVFIPYYPIFHAVTTVLLLGFKYSSDKSYSSELRCRNRIGFMDLDSPGLIAPH
jgi:hypothetical protein